MPTSLPHEPDVLAAVARGDEAAFRQLMDHYWYDVYTQAITYLKSAPLAQELTQDVFVKIWTLRAQLPEVRSFPDYLFIVARNQTVSALRKKKVRTELPSEHLETSALTPERALQYKESYAQLLALIDQMPPMRKKVFRMSRLEGLSYEEIGRALGLQREGVKTHIVKALNYLRTHLRNPGELSLLLLLTDLFLLRA